MAHLSRPFWGNTSKTIYYSSFLLCIHKVHVKTPVEASQPNKQSTIRPTRLDFAAFPVFFYLNCRWEVFWGQNSLCVDFQRDWSLSLGSSGESREERANSIALFPLDIWVKRSRICSFRSWKRSHFSAIYKQSSDSFKQLPLPSHCADGALQKAMMALPWRVLSCQRWGSDVWKAIWSPERIWSLENPEGEFLVLSNFYNPFLLSAYLQSDTLQKVWTTESLFPVRSLIWCDLWDLI